MTAPRGVAILGSTGSVGRAALEVVLASPGRLRVVALAARRNVERLAAQVERARPQLVAVADPEAAERLRRRLGDAMWLHASGAPESPGPAGGGPVVVGGPEGLVAAATHPEAEVVVVGIVGIAALRPTLAAAEWGKRIALASKEVLVAAGPLLLAAARRRGAVIVPADSEHNALFQCLVGEAPESVARVVLTASGGPFLRRPLETLETVAAEEVLAHPVWRMGPRITVDSATMMNKGLEVIEASHLFALPPERIEVLIHPQAVVHGMVEFVDGSVKAILAPPDMRIVLHHALHHPQRRPAPFGRLDLAALGPLTFERPDPDRYPLLALARQAARVGGTVPAVLNAADEVAVARFLAGAIAFGDIVRVVRRVVEAHIPVAEPDLEAILEADRWARAEAARVSDTARGRA